MAEIRFGMFLDVTFNLLPVAVVIADIFAVGANGKKAREGLDG